MRADSPEAKGTGLVLVLALLSNTCASLTPPPGQGMNLRHAPGEATGLAPLTFAFPPAPEGPERLLRRQGTREALTTVDPGGDEGNAWRSALAAHLAFRAAMDEVSGSTRRVSRELSRLRASHRGIAGRAGDAFVRYVEYGEAQQRWIEAELATATRLATAASEVDDAEMQLALLRLAGPRLEAAMLGSLLLAVWFDFLNLTDVALSRHLYGVETMFLKMEGWRKRMEPAMKALSSQQPEQVEAAARDMPALVGHLTEEFAAYLEAVHKGAEVLQKMLVLKEAMEAITTLSALKFTFPVPRPAAPTLLGVGLMVGPNGVMMGTRIVVSAEWVERVRQLVRAGILSLPAVSAAVRIQAGQVMMAHAHGELPRGVRDALGDGPEVRAMHETGRTGAGMARPPRHHVMPKEFREWFEKRGFSGEMDIDHFCVKLEQAHHEAIHGGGNWKLGRIWPGEWNRMIMEALREAELTAGRMLTRNEVLDIVAYRMRRYAVPIAFTRWSGQ
jgi:hypothetical protein